ncbi:MAG: uridine kinase [Bacteroidota bacterium]
MIIGICGGSGSGKTTLLNKLKSELNHLEPAIFSLDNYYLPIEKQKKDENGKVNFDLPTALDRGKISADLKKIIEGESIKLKQYHFNSPPYLNNYITIKPSQIIIIEGLFILHYEEIRQLLEMTIFVHLHPEIQLRRRILRDSQTRGYLPEEILYQWKQHVIPCYENYIHPYQHYANYIYRNDEFVDEDFEKIKTGIYTTLENRQINSVNS